MSLQNQMGSQGVQIILRAAIVALVLGGLLTIINQRGSVFGSQELDVLAMVQVFATPFLVVVASQILGLRAAWRPNARVKDLKESFLATMLSRGIPVRAILVGLAAVSCNATVAVTQGYLAGRGVDQLPLVLLAQALALPILFGAVSQTLTVRSALSIKAAF